ncbi:hypothetical protein L0U88_09220 [Flavihumibacter sp. RY-1]|uniref:CCDC81-like prokaryotic HU domain-containing protein n=1 Tax=Flavihumibacter fluminis TaxID=2909236 RepID=A0ABS9BJ07_9BACT|nr:hypothetical protein [Flavihumibacter fluminis]MCF1714804.1 hypothetical protein [Flavihumibacter fluminis]
MKIDHLVTQYLYQQKRLSLPGIGTFTMENGGIQFSNSADTDLNPELVEFIRTHTGKMTALAKSDLESYIMLNSQFLNIGKALYMEGIGTLVKAKEGSIEFTPGDMVMERLDERMPETKKTSVFEENPRYDGGSGIGRKLAIFLGIAATLGIVIWGGWKWSQKGAEEKENTETVTSIQPEPVLQTDTTVVATVDSVSRRPLIDTSRLNAVTAANRYKFIIETTNKKARALRRYNQLLEIKSGIKMETADSVTFKLYFSLPATVADTTRIKDSLRIFYASRVVLVEKEGN